jgi:PPK2 family polyphosphate:nucleotide phosphotransferase
MPSHHLATPGDTFTIAEHDTTFTGDYANEEDATQALEAAVHRIRELADRFNAQASHALLVVLQGFDGAGKDTVITNVMSAIDPAELHVFSFNKPVGDEADHDFLWRFHQQTPARGRVHVFDRSYYEEVISARVHDLIDAEQTKSRFESINDFERILARENTIILKFFLHVSKDKQADRVRERLLHRHKQHEFAAADVQDRELWDDYDRAYENAITHTSTDDAPWHVIPADHRWYARIAVAEILEATLTDLDPQYPPLDEDEVREAGLDPKEVLAEAERP